MFQIATHGRLQDWIAPTYLVEQQRCRNSHDRSQRWMRERRLLESADAPAAFEPVAQV